MARVTRTNYASSFLSILLIYSLITSLCAPLLLSPEVSAASPSDERANTPALKEDRYRNTTVDDKGTNQHGVNKKSPVKDNGKADSLNAVYQGNNQDKTKRTKDAPGPNLPNLDLMRNLRPDNPKAPPPIPSTRCPLQMPDCDKKSENKAGATIKQSVVPEGDLSKELAEQDELLDFMAWNSSPALSPFKQTESKISDAFPLIAALLRKKSPSFNSLISPPPFPPSDNYSQERMQISNRTGQPGEDLVSRNYNWSIPILGLRGRAGLDLSLSLTYNSLVWTKSGSTIAFDADHGFPSPGFRLGFPIIQSRYLNAQGIYSYLMITSSKPGGTATDGDFKHL